MTTPSLFDVLPEFAPTPETAGQTLQERFEAFHAANPWVYTNLCRLARSYRERRSSRVGVKLLIEVLRWEWSMTTTGDDWKLNNSFTSRYARLIMSQEADLADAFEVRELKAA